MFETFDVEGMNIRLGVVEGMNIDQLNALLAVASAEKARLADGRAPVTAYG